MPHSPDTASLDSFLSPRSIAVVGASQSVHKIGAVPLRYLIQHGYAGELYPINPTAELIEGRQAYASLRAVQRPIDLAIVAVPAVHVERAVEDAMAAGVRNLVMFSAGFAEAGDAGRAAQQSLATRARAAGIRLLGPNCLGFMNFTESVYATFSPVVSTGLPRRGHVGIVSQSGAFGAYSLALARQREVGLSCWITTGNEADVAVADCIAWMTSDPATRVIMASMEGCQDGRRLRHALELARAAGKPVVMVKVGRTALGAQAAASHTAALAGNDAAYEALFKQCGAWRAHSIEEFFDVAHALSVSPLPATPSVGLLTVSGGVGVMMADDAAQAGLLIEPLPEAVQARIRQAVPLASTNNPVDVTGQVTADPQVLRLAARAMLQDAGHGSLVIFLAAFGINPAIQSLARELARELRRDFPDRLVVFSTLASPEQARALEEAGCMCFADTSRALRIVAALVYFATRAFRGDEAVARPATPRLDLELPSGPINEADAMALLAKAGVPVVSARRACTRLQAVQQAVDLGFPVVMKVLSGAIAHKSDVGGVVLNIQDAGAAGAAFDQIMHRVSSAVPEAAIDGVLVAPMVRGGIECIVGMHRDDTFGPLLMLGSGGVNVELLGDVSFRLAPVNRDQAMQMIDELKTAPLLHGYRGAPPADSDALADAIVALSRFAMAAGDRLSSVELNPLVVRPKGSGVLALDALLTVSGAHAEMAERAPQATRDGVIETLPVFEMARMRAANTARRHPVLGFAGDTPGSRWRWVNQFTHTRRLRSPQDREVVTPNNDTLFTNAWLDLSDGPVVIDVPDMGSRYWVLGFLDAWTNPWAYAGRRTTGGQAQQVFVHGPRWQGVVPAGMHRVAAPGDDVWVIGRILVDAPEDDLARVHALQDRFMLRRPDGSPAARRLDVLVDGSPTGAPDAEDYLRVLQNMLDRNPAPIDRRSVLEGLQRLDRAALQKGLDEVYAELRETKEPSRLGGGWTMGVSVRTSFGSDFLTRARVARNWIGTLGIDEAMYVIAEVDAQGEPLTGQRRYVLRFAGDAMPKVGAFWSVTLYRRDDCLLVDNVIGRHSIGDRTPGLRLDRDGGLSIVISAREPADAANWLPCGPDEFFLVLRLYQPGAEHLEGRFAYPPVRALEEQRQ